MQTQLFTKVYKHKLTGQLMTIVKQTENICTCELSEPTGFKYQNKWRVVKTAICKFENLEQV